MKINEMYLIFDKNNELVKNYITTSGLAQCNIYGCISLKQEINSLRDLIKSYEEVKKEIDIQLDKIDGYKYIKGLENKEDNLYQSYYNTIHVLLNDEEIKQIQKSINYNFMSNLFIDRMIELLESKEV